MDREGRADANNAVKFAFCAAVCTAIIAGTTAWASPILLATSVDVNGGGTWTGSTIAPQSANAFSGIGYEAMLTNPASAISSHANVGLGRVFSEGTTGTFLFDATNDANFASVAALLTDGLAEQFFVAAGTVGTDGVTRAGSQYGGTEQVLLSLTTTDLAGATIDFFQLNLIQNTFGFNAGGSYSANVEAVWQIYGTPAAPVPEPGSGVLLISALTAMIALSASGLRRPAHAIR